MLFARLSRGADDSIYATLMEMDFITVKGSDLSISMKDVDEPYKRNLSHLKVYNKADYLKGIIFDAAVLAEA